MTSDLEAAPVTMFNIYPESLDRGDFLLEFGD